MSLSQRDRYNHEVQHSLYHYTYQSDCTFCNTQAETAKADADFEQAEIAYTNEKGG
jgi:hypothetical protein